MFICDYINDLGYEFKRYKPYIIGIDTLTNRTIPMNDVILQISQYIDMEGYFEVDNKEAICSSRGRKRKLILQKANKIYEFEYYQPFNMLDWSVFTDENIAVETIPEFINDGDLYVILKDWL